LIFGSTADPAIQALDTKLVSVIKNQTFGGAVKKYFHKPPLMKFIAYRAVKGKETEP